MMMKKIKKLTAAIVSAAVLFCAPVTSMAADTAGSQAEEIIMENVDNLLSDPGQVADIIVYVKELIDQQQITGDQCFLSSTFPRKKRRNSLLLSRDFPCFQRALCIPAHKGMLHSVAFPFEDQ